MVSFNKVFDRCLFVCSRENFQSGTVVGSSTSDMHEQGILQHPFDWRKNSVDDHRAAGMS